MSVDWETSEDTGGEHPADENDFVLASGTLTFDPGETEETITVEVVGDGSSEFDETFLVNLCSLRCTRSSGRASESERYETSI